MRVVGALLLVEMLLASAAPAPPPIAPKVLRAAMGRFDPGATIEMRGSILAEGRTGDYRETVRMRDGAFVDHAQYGWFGEGDGYDGRVRWRENLSAASHALNAPFSKADAVSFAWLKRRGYMQPGSARVDRVSREKIAGRPATVLTMRPRGGNSFRLAFDDSSHLLVRVQRERPLSIVTETYGDYRRVGSALAPFTIEIEDSGDVQTIHPSRYERLASSARTRFSAPPPPRDTIMAGPATLPLASLSVAVVPARINGPRL